MLQFEKIIKLWHNYSSLFVVKNQQNKTLAGITLLSQLLKCFFVDGGKKKPIREHLFMLSPNRTGKGELMKSMRYFMNFVNEKMGKKHLKYHYFANEPNPQQLVGGREMVGKNKWEYKPGLLKTYNFIMWGEGENLIKPISRWGDMQNLILNALDDGSPISPTARKDMDKTGDIPTFYTNTSLITGTRPLQSMNLHLSASGILQRFLFNNQNFTQQDYKDLRKEILKLASGKNIYLSREIKEKLFHTIYENRYEKEIGFGEKAIKEYSEYKESLIEKITDDFNKQDLKTQAVQGFITGTYNHDKKIASMITSLEGEKFVFPEAFKIAANITQKSINSFTELIDDKYEPTKSQAKIKREQTIIKTLNISGGWMTRQQLLNELLSLRKQGFWDVGKNKTDIIIKELIKQKIINVTTKEKRKQIYHLNIKATNLKEFIK